MVLDLYKKSNLPEKTYYQCFVTLLFRGYKDVVEYMVHDMVHKDNVNRAIDEFKDYIAKDDTGDIKRFEYDKLWDDAKDIYNLLLEIKKK